MIIGIERGLEGIKNYLEALQCYQIYYLDAYDGPLDAMIYNCAETIKAFEQYQFESVSNALEAHSDISEGTLMIKATHKTGEEIHELLDARWSE